MTTTCYICGGPSVYNDTGKHPIRLYGGLCEKCHTRLNVPVLPHSLNLAFVQHGPRMAALERKQARNEAALRVHGKDRMPSL